MATLTNRTLGSVENFAQLYDFLMVDLADPRTNDWFLVRDPVCFYIVGVYLMFVLRWGPAFMKDRKPLTMKGTLVAYNAVQVAVSVYLLYEGLDAAWLYKYSWRCQPVDFSTTPEAMRVGRASSLHLLPGQNLRAAGHRVLRFTQTRPPDHVPASLPPRSDAHDQLGCQQVLPWWPRHADRCHQLLRARHHVLLLLARGSRTAAAQIPVVEKIYHHSANGAVLSGLHPFCAVARGGVRLPQVVSVAGLAEHNLLLLSLQRLLRQVLRESTET